MFDKKLLLILAVGLVLRLGLWSWFSQCQTLHDDERDYNQLAHTLVQYGEFGFEQGAPVSIRPPLYPATLAAIYSVFGVDNFQAVRMLQIALSLATVVLVFALGKEVYSQQVGIAAAAMYAFYPSLLVYNNLILTETQFTFLLVGFCLALTKALKTGSFAYLALAGVLLGLGALTRSVLWMFPPLLVLFLVAFWPGRIWPRCAAAILVVLMFAVPVAPWTVRNTRLQKTFTAVDCMGGRNFMMGNYQHTPLFGSWATIGLQGEKSWSHEVQRENPSPPGGWTQGQIDKLALKQGLKFAVAHPGLTLQRDFVKFLDFWGLERVLVSGALQGYFGPLPRAFIAGAAALIFGAYAAALFAGMFGALMVRSERKAELAFLVLMLVYVCGIHSVVFGHSRYHLPLMPIVLVFAAAAWVHAREIWAQRRTWPFAAATGLCLFFLVGWGGIFLMEDAGRLRKLLGGSPEFAAKADLASPLALLR